LGIINPQFLISLFGIVFAAIGVAARLGRWKNWYWQTRGSVYGYVPLGLLFLLYAYKEEAVARLGPYYILYQGLLGILVAVGLWWSLRPPEFVKPAWVRWVEEYPKNVQEAMRKAAEAGDEWEPHMASPEELKAWVKTLRSKKAKSRRRG